MATSETRLVEQTEHVVMTVHGRYLPTPTWAAPCLGVLWAQDDALEFADWLQQTADGLSVQPVSDVPEELLHTFGSSAVFFCASDFAKLAFRLSSWLPGDGRVHSVAFSPELSLYLRMARLAVTLVEQEDVVAFAAPAGADWHQVLSACFALTKAGEDGMGEWGSQEGAYVAAWVPAWRRAPLRALSVLYLNLSDEMFSSAWKSSFPWRREEHGRTVAHAFIWRCVDEVMRGVWTAKQEPSESDGAYRVMYRGEVETIQHWQRALAGEKRDFPADGWLIWRALRQGFTNSGWQPEWLVDKSGRLFYHLEFELMPPEGRGLSGDWKLVFFVSHNEWDVRAPLSQWWGQSDRKWRIGKDVLTGPDEWFLPKLREVSKVCDALARALQTPAVAECTLSPNEVFAFLTQELVDIEEHGVRVRFPQLSAAELSDVRIRVHVKRMKTKTKGAGAVQSAERWFDAGQLVDFDWTVAIGDEVLTRQDFDKMVEQNTPFVELAGSWKLVPVQAILAQVEELRAAARSGSELNMMQFLRTVLMNRGTEEGEVALDVDFDDDAMEPRRVLDALVEARAPELVQPPKGFVGTLRQYQQFGYSWLLHLRSVGCGGILADDMGLGKTIQVLCYLQQLKETGQSRGPHLLVCPTSLVQNWRAEAARFTPELCIHVHHGAGRNAALPGGATLLSEALSTCDVVLTTYATTVRDSELLEEQTWDVIVADEAQNVKNSDTKQAQVLRSLSGNHCIALTGTPIENRLEELWSIFQFTTPGYLGNLSWFRRAFANPIATNRDKAAAARLHQLLAPVLLRRSKTDPNIQMELPEKWESTQFAGLASEQAALYQSVVNRLFDELNVAQGMSRRGQILTALVRLKQVCDHPCLMVGGRGEVTRSGKLKLLLDLMESVVLEGEAALVFTQFRDMGELICEALFERFGWKPRFLHGGLSAVERGNIVERFQSGQDPSPVLVLSLKAGGVGLNLTRANHVFHYDRWWNPAVEDQATDRAYRIGQQKDVQVHKLICPGTLEDRIDQLIQSKRQLSSVVVGVSEGWITELDDDSLRSLFALDLESAVEDDE